MEIAKFNINDYLKGRVYKIKKDYEEKTKCFITGSMSQLSEILIQNIQECKVRKTAQEMNIMLSTIFDIYSLVIIDVLEELGVMDGYQKYGFKFVDTDKPNLKILVIKFDRNIAKYAFSYEKPIG